MKDNNDIVNGQGEDSIDSNFDSVSNSQSGDEAGGGDVPAATKQSAKGRKRKRSKRRKNNNGAGQ